MLIFFVNLRAGNIFVTDYDYQASKYDALWFFTKYDYQSKVKIYYTDHDYQAKWVKKRKVVRTVFIKP
ncbi:hypothetical protein BH10BAC5_BH10BAC5_19250 [soil metagenome]